MDKYTKTKNLGAKITEAYQRLLKEEVERVGRNEAIILSDEQIKDIAELKVRGKFRSDGIVEDTSHIAVYTQSCQVLEKRYGSLQGFWKHVINEFITSSGYMFAMAEHGDDECPHIHLIIKTEKYVDRWQLGYRLGEVEFSEDSCYVFEDTITYYFQSLEEVYHMFLQDSYSPDHARLAVGMTPDFANYLVKAESCKQSN